MNGDGISGPRKDRPIVIGHRGAAARSPENTLASFSKAMSLGADMVELDVHLSKDRELVVIHDDAVDRTTNGSGLVADLPLSQLKALNAGGGERIPTLPEVMELLGGRCGINIELKGPDTSLPVHRLLTEAVEDGSWKSEKFLVSSFNPLELKEFSGLEPKFPAGVLVEGIPDGAEELAEILRAVSVHPEHEHLKKEHIGLWHGRGLKVFPWTVDDAGRMRELISWGVDGLITDDPALLVSVLKER